MTLAFKPLYGLYLLLVPLLLSPLDAHSAEVSPDSPKVWSAAEWRIIQSLSIDRLKPPTDPSNRYQNNPAAARLGKKLFFDRRLSKNGRVACASCHDPANHFTDGKVIARGQDLGKRNTPSLRGVAHNRWFLWDGGKDSLWSQALAPFENSAEHDFPRTRLAKLIQAEPVYRHLYQQVFGSVPISPAENLADEAQPSGSVAQIKAWKKMPASQRQQIDTVFAHMGKAIAAYLSTLPPVRTRLDDYIASYTQPSQAGTQQPLSARGYSPSKLSSKPPSTLRQKSPLSPQELAGLRLFIQRESQCINCHFGPLLTNQSFHNVGTGGAQDSGRAAALDKIRFDRFNCLGDYSDAKAEQCAELRFMQRDRHTLRQAFKTPTLRNISNTAPYFHDGSSPTLAAVIHHYTQLAAGAAHLQAPAFSAQEQADLLAFLKALAAKD